MKTASHSNTIRLASVQILSGIAGYLGGQMDAAAAGVLVVTGVIQIVQRLISMRAEAAQAGPEAAPSFPQGQ